MNEIKVLWEIGGEPFNFSKTIKVIKRGTVRIYPHLVFDKLMNYNEMFVFANTLANSFKILDVNCFVYEKNTYTYEMNGNWNVVLSVKYTNPIDNKEYRALFAIINSRYYKKTYFCPFYNTEYTALNHHSINNESSLAQFELLTLLIKNKLDVKQIESFPYPCHLL